MKAVGADFCFDKKEGDVEELADIHRFRGRTQ